MITDNEKKVLKYLLVNFNRDLSINQIAKGCHISPNGAYKILKKLQKESILEQKAIANIKSFKINIKKQKSQKVLELAFMDNLEGKIKYRSEDLKLLKDITDICIIFGSYTKKTNPHDLDLLIILEKKNFKKYKENLKSIKDIVPVKVHDVLQTKVDLINNLKEDSKVIKEAIREGIVLWGQEELVGVFTDVY